MGKRSRDRRPSWRKKNRRTNRCLPTTWFGKNRLLAANPQSLPVPPTPTARIVTVAGAR